jgi:hypothetical protein
MGFVKRILARFGGSPRGFFMGGCCGGFEVFDVDADVGVVLRKGF